MKKPKPKKLPQAPSNSEPELPQNPAAIWLLLGALGLLASGILVITGVGLVRYSVSLLDTLVFLLFAEFFAIKMIVDVYRGVIPGSSKWPGATRRDQHPVQYWALLALYLIITLAIMRSYISFYIFKSKLGLD